LRLFDADQVVFASGSERSPGAVAA
jgi:hypothetical protein